MFTLYEACLCKLSLSEVFSSLISLAVPPTGGKKGGGGGWFWGIGSRKKHNQTNRNTFTIYLSEVLHNLKKNFLVFFSASEAMLTEIPLLYVKSHESLKFSQILSGSSFVVLSN